MSTIKIDLNAGELISGRMYLGSMDDSVTRHPWSDMTTDMASLNKSLIYYALLGPKICSRIGNIIYHEPYLKALLDGPSPLLPLCRSGFFQIQTREDTINANIVSRLQEGTNSTLSFVKHYDWRNGSDLYWRFENIDAQLVSGKGKIKYTPSFKDEFVRLSDKCANITNKNYTKIYEIWRDQFQEKQRTRSNFEITCLKYLKSHSEIADAMSVINSINHYAYGMGLATQANQGDNIFIETREVEPVNYLTTPLLSENDEPPQVGFMNDLIRSKALDIVEKNLFIPINLFYDSKKWEKLGELLDIDRSNPASVRFFELKQMVIIAIKHTIENGGASQQKAFLAATCREYSAFINDQLNSSTEAQTSVYVKLRQMGQRFVGEIAKTGGGEGVGAAVEALQGGLPEKILVGAVFAIGAETLSHQISRKVGDWRSERQTRKNNRAADLRALHSCLSVRRMKPVAAS